MKSKPKIQNLKPKITIVGAGPAGTSLAIRLAKQNFQVTLIEREKFPRHKLCGEFISPECLEHFQDLEVFDEMLIRGGDRITQTIFYSENGKNVSIPSEWFNGNSSGALGLSRAEMDFRLMEKAKSLGVEVLEETSVVGVLLDEEKVCGVKVRNLVGENREIFSEITIDATGRTKFLAKKISDFRFQMKKKTEAKNEGQRTKDKHQNHKNKIRNPQSAVRNQLVGFKVHLKNVQLPKGRCEIYFFRGGYGGLNYVEDGIANHCFLIKADIVKEFKGDADKILDEVIFQNKRAKEMLIESEKEMDWLAVSVDGFGIKNLNPAKNLFTVGDAAAFIDPFTGSGMLMAFEGAEVLADLIIENKCLNDALATRYENLYKAKFQNRLRICSIMRHLSFAPGFAKLAISLLGLSRSMQEILVHSTRQTKLGKRT